LIFAKWNKITDEKEYSNSVVKKNLSLGYTKSQPNNIKIPTFSQWTLELRSIDSDCKSATAAAC